MSIFSSWHNQPWFDSSLYYASILIGPCLAFVYEITVVLFLIGFGEMEIPWYSTNGNNNSNRLSAIAIRTAQLVAILSINHHHFDHYGTLQSILLFITSFTLSFYFMYHTRLFIRGPVPPSSSSDENDMSYQTILITGANTGIGKETARQLAARGATVILACRDLQKAQDAVRDIQKSLSQEPNESPSSSQQVNNNNNKLVVLQLDLSSFQSIRNAVETYKKMKLPNNPNNTLDVLINNAGVMSSHKQMSQDGYELCLQANHLGHFLLTSLLLPYLQQSSSSSTTSTTTSPDSVGRVLNLTSITYKMARRLSNTTNITNSLIEFEFDDYNCNQRPYTLFTTYSQSKLANILFTKELARRYPTTLVSLAINPGIVRTDVTRNMSWWLQSLNAIFGWVVSWYQKTPTEGAYSTVWAAMTTTTTRTTTTSSNHLMSSSLSSSSDPNSKNGAFVYNSHVEPTCDYCCSESVTKLLWEWSERLIAEKLQR